MMPVERQRKIVTQVNERGSIRVTEISRMFDVTPETARRDLDTLAAEGKVRRSHGGAVCMDSGGSDIPYGERENTNAIEKMEIARLAASFIEPGDKIVLDASSTAWFLANTIADMPLTVLTNSVRVIDELSKKEKIQVISTGGILRTQSMSFIGPLAEETLSKYYVNKAFISCKGIHVDHGATESSELQALIKARMAAIADVTYLMADASKFGVRDFTQAVNLSDVSCILTNSETTDRNVRAFEAVGVSVQKSEVGSGMNKI